MNYLLDTHTYLWFINDDAKLSIKAKSIIENPGNDIYLSSAVVWEISIKAAIGKIELYADLDKFIAETLQQYNFIPLGIMLPHAIRVHELPAIHHDPFDRILIAQSLVEDFQMITFDPQIKKYKVKTIW